MAALSPDAKLFGDLVQVRCVGSFGSGLLVRRGIVLTALHCVANPDRQWAPRKNLQVFLWRDLAGLNGHLRRERSYRARIAWPLTPSERPPDVAVLVLEDEEVPDPFVRRDFTELPIMEFEANILGFPKLASGAALPGGRVELHLAGTAFYAQASTGSLLFNASSSLANATVANRPEDGSGREFWSGLSGGPLLSNSDVLAVVRQIPKHWDRAKVLEAEPLDGLLRDPANSELRHLLGLTHFSPFVAATTPNNEGDINISVLLAGLTHSYRQDVLDFCTAYLGTSSARRAFGGRDEQLGDLIEWLRCPVSRISRLVLGPAGVGKSTLLLHAIQAVRNTTTVAFVPISIRFGTNSEAALYTILAGRLTDICGLPPLAAAGGTHNLYREHCLELLARIANDGPDIVIVVDGLDEAVGWVLDPRVFRQREHVRFLVAARPELGGPRLQVNWAERLGWSPKSVEAMDLGALDVLGVEAVLRSAKLCVNSKLDDAELLREVHRLTQGDPLLLGYYVEDLQCQVRADCKIDIEILRTAEAGFSNYFRAWLREQNPIWEDVTQELSPSLEALLAIFASALGPLRFQDLEHLMAVVHGEMGITIQRVYRLGRFVMEGPDGFLLNHPRLAIHLKEELFRSGKLVRQSSEALLDWCLRVAADLNEGRLVPEHAPPYALQFLPQHLHLGNAKAKAYLCIAGPGWLRAWVAREGWYRSYAFQLGLAQHEIAARSCSGDPWRGWILRCELMLNTLRQVGDAPPEVIVACVDKGVLSRVEAFSRLELMSVSLKVPAVAALLGGLNEREQSQRLEECVELLPKISGALDRARATCSLLPWVTDEETRKSLEANLFDLLNNAGNMASWLELIDIIMPAVSLQSRSSLVENGLLHLEFNGNWRALLPLLDYLTSDEAQDVYVRATQLAPIGQENDGQDLAGRPLVAFLPRLPLHQQSRLWSRALNHAEQEQDNWEKTNAFVAAYPLAPEELRTSFKEQMLKAARAADGTLHGRINCTALVAAILSLQERRELLPELIEDSLSDLNTSSFSRLRLIVPLLAEEDVPKVLVRVLSSQDRRGRHNALGDLAPRLDPDQLRSALPAMTEFRDSPVRALAAVALSLHLPDDIVEARLIQSRVPFNEPSGQALVAAIVKILLPKTPPDLWPRLCQDLENIFSNLEDRLLKQVLGAYVNAFPERAVDLLCWANEIQGDGRYAVALSGIAAKLTGDDTLGAWRNLQRIQLEGPNYWHAAALRAAAVLAERLPPAEATEAMAYIVKSYEQLYPSARAEIVCRLGALGFIPLAEATARARGFVDKNSRYDDAFYCALISFLSGTDRSQVLSEAIEQTASRGHIELITLLPSLTTEERASVLPLILESVRDKPAEVVGTIAGGEFLDSSLKRALLEMVPDWVGEMPRDELMHCIAQLTDQLAELEGTAGVEAVAAGLEDLATTFP